MAAGLVLNRLIGYFRWKALASFARPDSREPALSLSMGRLSPYGPFLRRRLVNLADPDVAEAEGRAGVAVGLEFDGRAIESFVEGGADVAGLAF